MNSILKTASMLARYQLALISAASYAAAMPLHLLSPPASGRCRVGTRRWMSREAWRARCVKKKRLRKIAEASRRRNWVAWCLVAILIGLAGAPAIAEDLGYQSRYAYPQPLIYQPPVIHSPPTAPVQPTGPTYRIHYPTPLRSLLFGSSVIPVPPIPYSPPAYPPVNPVPPPTTIRTPYQ